MDLDVKYIARLARLKLNAAEIKLLEKQLEGVLSYINKLKEVSIEGVAPTTHVLPLKNVFREDEVKPSAACEDLLKGAPGKKDSFFKVPPILKQKS